MSTPPPPPPPLPPNLPTHHSITTFYNIRYDFLTSTSHHPLLYPQAALGALCFLIVLLIDYRTSRARRLASYAAFAFMAAWQVWIVGWCRARNPAAAFGVGLVGCFGVFWGGGLVVLGDWSEGGFRRVERRRVGGEGGGGGVGVDGEAGVSGSGSGYGQGQGHGQGYSGDYAVRQRLAAKQGEEEEEEEEESTTTNNTPRQKCGPLFWQPYPSSAPILDRLDWLIDLFISFRGVGWTWQSSQIPDPPNWVQRQLRGDETSIPEEENQPSPPEPPLKISKTGIRRFHARRPLLQSCLLNLALGYIALDGVKTLLTHDPYTWYGDHSLPPPTFLPAAIRASPVLTKSYRLLLCLCAINTALWSIFKLGPVFFAGILGPQRISLRGEPWMNPADMFGDFTHVLDSGLAGWWGAWWHQTFRQAFQVPGDRLVDFLGWERRSVKGRLVATWVAFFLSGCLHASGSYTQLGDTYPLRGQMAFFLLQALGVTVQMGGGAVLVRAGVTRWVPRFVRRAGNLGVVVGWLYFTAPLLVDDFARGGIWLFEPVPFSLFRGLGLGSEGDGWWCWGGGLVEWRSGEGWWDTGIAP